MTGVTPARLQVSTAWAASGRGGSISDQREEGQPSVRVRPCRPLAPGDGEHAERVARQALRPLEQLLARVVVEFGLARGRQLPRARGEHDLGRAFCIGDDAIRRLVQRRHPLALGGERDLIDAREPVL
jgi:hypothetical protein